MSDRGGKTDVRWSSEEWAALERLAVASGLSPGRVVKRIVRRAVLLPAAGWAGAPVRDVGGPAVPEGKGTRRAAASGIEREAISGPELAAGGDVLGSGGDLGTGPAASPSRPAESAGCVGPVPPAGVAAAGDAPSSAAAPVSAPVGAVKLERAVAAALTARFGQREGLLAMARRDVRAGKVRVDGVVCIDPERLVDPGALGS